MNNSGSRLFILKFIARRWFSARLKVENEGKEEENSDEILERKKEAPDCWGKSDSKS